jgi:hypothetical protein
MRRWFLSMQLASGALGIMLFTGCFGGPPALVSPKIDSSAAGTAAVAKYDKNSDSALDDTELKACPAILKAKAKFDKDGDGKVNANDIAARIGEWQADGTGLTTFALRFTLDGKALEGAEIKLVPEEWLGAEIKPGSGKTDASGNAGISIASSDLLENEAGLTGMRFGLYRIEVTHPTAKIPAKFNTATELGIEIGPSDASGGREVIALTSK